MTQATAPSAELASVRGGPVVDERITETLAAFCVSSDAGSLPAAAMEAARRLALDFSGVALRGSIEPSSRVTTEAVRRLAPPCDDGSTMIGHGWRTSPQYAAMHNGVSVHGLELDDTHPRGGIHLGGAIFAAAFAMGERVEASGAKVLVAAILGYEVSARLAMALPLAAHSGHGFHATGTCNVFGAAAACAKLLRLDVEQTVNALGIAGSQSAGSLEYRTEGAWTKRLHPGWAAHCGVVAAELARAGFTGPHRIIEGRAGFLRSYSDAPRADLVLNGLGSDYEVRRTAIKPHAACRHSQAAIDALSGLASTHALVPPEIERITVRIFQAALASVAEPEARKRRPKTMVDAQFNIFFASAAAILWGGPTLAHYGPETLESPELLGLMDRVVCVPDPELSALFPEVWPAKVEVLLRDGRTLTARVDYPSGDPENPLSWDQLVTKFQDVTEGVVSPSRQREIVRASETFADHPVERFTRLLATES